LGTENLIAQILTGGTAGIVAALLLVIVLLLKGVLVPGYVYTVAMTKLTRYEEMAFKAMTVAERESSRGGAG